MYFTFFTQRITTNRQNMISMSIWIWKKRNNAIANVCFPTLAEFQRWLYQASFPLVAKANSQAHSECFQILWLDESCPSELASWLLRWVEKSLLAVCIPLGESQNPSTIKSACIVNVFDFESLNSYFESLNSYFESSYFYNNWDLLP